MAKESTIKLIGAVLVGVSVLLVILLSLIKAGLDEQSAFLCSVVSSSDMDMSSCPVHKSNTSWLLIVAFSMSFLALGAGAFLLLKPLAERKAFPKLDEQEKQVYDLLKSHEGSLYQSDILKEAQLSKVKLTRLLDKMEQKGILERKRRGMTNIIVLR